MQPYNSTQRNKHRTENRDDLHRKTADGGKVLRKKKTKTARKAARRDGKKQIKQQISTM